MNKLTQLAFVAVFLPALLLACGEDDDRPGPVDGSGDSRPDGGSGDGSSDAASDVVDAVAVMVVDAPATVTDVAIDGTVGPGEQVFIASLNGAQEVPAVATLASGSAAFILNADRSELRYTLRHNVTDATAAHLHAAAAGENGMIIEPIMPLAAESSGTIPLTPTLATDLEAGKIYVNVHSPAYVNGEIRGQILRPGEVLYTTGLTGLQETPPITTTATGSGSLILNAAKTSVHFRVATTGITPTMAHIHKGMAKTAGPPVYLLTPLGATMEGNQAVTAADLQDLEAGLWYINVHSTPNPLGEIRGQLLLPGARMFVATLTGVQEVPAVTTTSAGNGMVVLAPDGGRIQYHLNTTAVPTAAHFHRAPGGVAGPVEISITTLGPSMTGQTAISADQRAGLERGLLYLNVYTATNPAGEVRGQILGFGETLFTAVLSGAEEVPPVVTTATGGIGFILNAAGTQLRYDGTIANLIATMAHVHLGPIGVAGPVVHDLGLSGTSLQGNFPISAADRISLNGAGWYANVHSAMAPTGEVRGQMLKR